VPVPLHLYAELAKTDVGCSILSEYCNIKQLLATLINSNAQNSNVSAGKQCLYIICDVTYAHIYSSSSTDYVHCRIDHTVIYAAS
jgi:hypothetical protein